MFQLRPIVNVAGYAAGALGLSIPALGKQISTVLLFSL